MRASGGQQYLVRAPLGFGQWLVALDYALSRPSEIAIVGSPDDEATRALLGAATSGFQPHQVVAYGPAGVTAAAVPLLEDRDMVDGQPAAYVCRDFACQAPVTESGLESLLGTEQSPRFPRLKAGMSLARTSCSTSSAQGACLTKTRPATG